MGLRLFLCLNMSIMALRLATPLASRLIIDTRDRRRLPGFFYFQVRRFSTMRFLSRFQVARET